MMKQRIIPHLWFDEQAEEAVAFYTSLFENSSVGLISRYGKAGFEQHGQPEGRVLTIEFELAGERFIALNGGPLFRFTPAISFFVTRETEDGVDALWAALAEGGEALMPLDSYPWSAKYGWVRDRYGVTWQLALGRVEDVGRIIAPSLLFVGDRHGQAEAAVHFYTAIFSDSAIDGILHTPPAEGEPPTIMHAQFALAGEKFMAMDGGRDHDYTFTEAISLVVLCETQAEIDHYWAALGAGGDPSAQQCGWLEDRFGVSWQVVPEQLGRMMTDADEARRERVMRALLKMKKLDLGELQRAAAGVERLQPPAAG